MSRSSRILVLGAHGMLGSHLTAVLNERRVSFAFEQARMRFERGRDIWDFLTSREPTSIVNCMGYTGQDASEHVRVNAFFPRVIGDYTQAADALFVQISTNAVFPADPVRHWFPGDPLDPRTPYEVAKALGEDRRAYVIRTSFIGASPRGRGIFDRLRAGKPYSDRRWNGVTVRTLAHYIVDVILDRDGKSTTALEHLHSPGVTTFREICGAIGSVSLANAEMGSSRLLGGGPVLSKFGEQIEEYLRWLPEAEKRWGWSRPRSRPDAQATRASDAVPPAS